MTCRYGGYKSGGHSSGSYSCTSDQMDNVINDTLNPDHAAQGCPDAEVQGTNWGVMDSMVFVAEGAGKAADAQTILNDALANGLDFEVEAGDLAGVVAPRRDASYQRSVVAIEMPDCLC